MNVKEDIIKNLVSSKIWFSPVIAVEGESDYLKKEIEPFLTETIDINFSIYFYGSLIYRDDIEINKTTTIEDLLNSSYEIISKSSILKKYSIYTDEIIYNVNKGIIEIYLYYKD